MQAKSGEYGADCLVDSGATLSLLSSKVWSTIKGTVSLEKFDKEIVSASGNVLDTKGKANVCFVINGVKCVMDVVIAEMDIDVILGLDFMSTHNVIVDVVGMTMHIKGTVCPLVKIDKIGCYQVIVKERDNEIDEVEELESAHQPVMDTDRDYESDRKRVRRKPVWAKDYVFSCRMVNTNVTPRKHNMADKTKTRCTWCKGLFEEGDQYEQHMIKCYRNRCTCHACGNTFKLKSYLEKHKRTEHQAWASINRTLKRSVGHFKVGLKTNSHVAKVNVDEEKHNLDDQSKVKDSKEKQVSDGQVQKKEETVSTAKKVESVDLVFEENSDWDKSPDVSLMMTT